MIRNRNQLMIRYNNKKVLSYNCNNSMCKGSLPLNISNNIESAENKGWRFENENDLVVAYCPECGQ